MAKGATTNKLNVAVRTRTGKGASRQARRCFTATVPIRSTLN